MPYENEHACRLREPGKYKRFTRITRKSTDGKVYSVIFGWYMKEGKEVSEEQAYRYNKEAWTASEARAHCDKHDGKFEAAKKEDECFECEELDFQTEFKDIEYKDFSFKLKDMDEKGRFQGMLSTNGNIDPVKDRFNPGTWKRTVANNRKEGFPLLWGHDSKLALGSFIAKDIEEGLLIDPGRLNLDMISNTFTPAVPKAHEAYALYRKKEDGTSDLKGLSVGFRNIESATKYPKVNGVVIRDMFEAQLYEGSFAPIPMNPLARVTNLKSWDDIFTIIINNLNNKDLKYKIFSLYGIDPELLESTLKQKESDYNSIQEIEPKEHWFKQIIENYKGG